MTAQPLASAIMQSAFTAGTSPLHKLHPLTKLTAALLIVMAAYLFPGLLSPLALFICVVVMAFIAGVARSFLRGVLLALLPITVSLFLIQGILFPPPNA